MIGTPYIRALNADNKVELDKLIELFFRAFGKRYPISGAYDNRFWSTQIGHRIISIGIFLQNNLVGHVGLRPDGGNVQHVQVCFAVLDPRIVHLWQDIAPQLRELISSMSKRQDWQAIYHFDFDRERLQQFFTKDIVGNREPAILPAFFADPMRPEQNPASLIGLKLRIHLLKPRSDVIVYPPPVHRDIVTTIFDQLEIPAQIGKPVKKSKKQKRSERIESTGLKMISPPGDGCYMALATPSNCSDIERCLTLLSKIEVRSKYLFVDLADPETPNFCDLMREYRFVGVVPCLQGRDSIVYWQGPNFDLTRYHSFQSRLLAEYSQSYSLTDAQAQVAAIDYSQS